MKRRNFLKLVGATGALATTSASLTKALLDGFPTLKESHKVLNSTLSVIDAWPGIEYYLDKGTKHTINSIPQALQQTHQWWDTKSGCRRVDIVRPVVMKAKTLRQGCEGLAKALVQINKERHIVAQLSKGVAFVLADGSYAVTSYLVIDTDDGKKPFEGFSL